MKVIDNEVVLNKHEDTVVGVRDQILATGHVHPITAAEEALDVMQGRITKQFVEYLSDGALTYAKGEVVHVEPEPANA